MIKGKNITFILIGIILVSGFRSLAQNEFQHHYGTTQVEVCHDVHATSDGGFIMSGMTYETYLTGTLGAVLVKTDANGAVEWTFAAAEMATTRYVTVVEDLSDNGFIVATSTGDHFRAASTAALTSWIFKVDQNGVLVWSKYIMGDAGDAGADKDKYDQFNSIKATSDGNFIAFGYSENDSYTVSASLNSNNSIACKFTSAGTVLWTRAIGSTGYNYGLAVEQCSDNNYLLFGYTSGGKLSITKIAQDGNSIIWSNEYNMGNTSYWPGGSYTGWGSIIGSNCSMIETSDGGIVVAGYAWSGTFGGDDYFAMKLNSTGGVLWSKRYGEGGDETASGVIELPNGDLLLSGQTRSTLLRANDQDMLLIRLNQANGNVIWAKTYNEIVGSQEYETSTSIELVGANSIIIGGAVDNNDICGGMEMSLTLMDISGDLTCAGSGALVMTDRTAVLQNAVVSPIAIATTFVIETVTPNERTGGEFGPWALDCDVEICSVILPITLTSFEAENKGGHNLLTWSTSSEINNDYFTLEKSNNTKDWEIVGEIPGAGNSNELLSYQFPDYTPYTDLTYYRLKQTDYDGRFEYSRIISLETKTTGVVVSDLFPNPASKHFSFNYYGIEGDLHISIYNAQGKLISDYYYDNLVGNGELTVPTDKLINGMYFVHIRKERIFQIKKLSINDN